MDRNDRWGDLLRRANRGEGAAYALFLTECAPVIRNVVRGRRGDSGADDIEDIVQEVLLAVHAKRHTWREADPVTPWLYAIARYKTADAGRKRRTGGTQVPLDDVAEVLPDEASGEIMAVRDLGVMLDRIDERSAGIVRAVGIAGESAGEVGARLGMSEGAVRVAYHRAMTRLKDLAEAKDETRE
ncbi:sigma-70 family RNA polymerase sigma factor [Pseudooceanicola sp.]|uniref:sigma-70 family RNA polymerase sigma factor n=1 Tax=Pseudooceanicola sp. TaxID=1914328 RepID=UPI00262DBB8E|nr:sigma-70 family RNA polymerase sigma factor [Pseudooceanicola sp.]MDF1854002.1 sigma-70 family RNA polymerase sigma factor [Pseudooceanicola sp.]